jgi:hypothetical protein
MTLRDKAYEVARSACGAKGHAEAKDALQKAFPLVEWDKIVEAYLDAARMDDAAYEFGDRLIRGGLSEQEAVAEARRKFPNFSDGTYRIFLSKAVLVAR